MPAARLRPLRALIAAAAALVCACGQGAETTVGLETITHTSTPPPTSTPTSAPTSLTAPTPVLAAGVVDVAGARAALDAWNAARARAQADLDATGLAAIETAPALDSDRVELSLERSGAARRGAGPSVDSVSVAVPRQAAFPAIAYATQRLTRGTSTSIEALAFTRQSEGAPWLLSWHATTPDATTPVPGTPLDAGGFATAIDATGQHALVTDVPTLATRLAASFRPGAAADPAIVLDQGMPDIGATARQTVSSFARSGGSAQVDFSGAPTPIAVATGDGGAACMVVVTYTATLNAPAGHPLVETAAQHQYGGGLLAPGDYAQVVDRYVFTFAASVPATTTGVTIFVFAVGGGLVSATGTPAPPTPSP